MFKGMLKNMGADQVTISSSGEAAIVRCSEQPFDIIFIDYNLGSGRNGRQLYEELKERRLIPSHNVSIIVTGESMSSMVVGALEIQPDDYIVKPFSQSLLKQRVSRIWYKKQALLDVIDHMERKDYDLALNAVNAVIQEHPRLKALCLKFKAEILFKQRQFDVLNVFLDDILAQNRISWALIYKSKVLQ